jgi:hypothetical protein
VIALSGVRVFRYVPTLNLAVQTGLCGFTALSVFFTWRILEQSATQLAILRQQARVEYAPYLVVGIADVDSVYERKAVQSDLKLTAAEKEKALKSIDESPSQFVCAVTNASSKIAHNLQAVLFDSSKRSYILCEDGKQVLGEHQEETFVFGWNYLEAREVVSWLHREYGEAAAFFDPLFAPEEMSYVVVIYQDIQDRVYLAKRSFGITDEWEIIHKPASIIFDKRHD